MIKNSIITRLGSFTAPKRTLITTGSASALLLAGAHAFEKFGGMAPCPLCLDQREVHWAALFLTIIAYIACQGLNARRVTAAAIGVLGLVYICSAVLATYHAGVEWKFWPGPPTCSASAGLANAINNPGDLLSQLNSAPLVSCSDAAWRFLGISMAGYNALLSLGLAALAFAASLRLARVLRAVAIENTATRG